SGEGGERVRGRVPQRAPAPFGLAPAVSPGPARVIVVGPWRAPPRALPATSRRPAAGARTGGSPPEHPLASTGEGALRRSERSRPGPRLRPRPAAPPAPPPGPAPGAPSPAPAPPPSHP